jgi:hypothetical protein
MEEKAIGVFVIYIAKLAVLCYSILTNSFDSIPGNLYSKELL